jgi:RNA polymerase-binding transcription factor
MNAHQGSREPRGPTPEALAAAREMLESERARTRERLTGLEREFGGIVESARADNADDEHDPEGATIAFERQHIAALIGQAQDHLTEIEAALRRLDQGDYGFCASCGRPIAPERLAARPTATMCVACASRRA